MTSTRPVRRYLFTLVDGGGTVPPELGTVQRLVERGHDVTVIVEESMLDEARQTGAAVRTWRSAPNRATRQPDDDPYRDWECTNPLALVARLLDRQLVGPAPAYATDTAAAIAEVRPELVVCSFFALGAMAAAEAAGVPFDVLFPNAYLLPAPGIPPFGLGLAPARGPFGRARDRAITAVTSRQWDRGLGVLERPPRPPRTRCARLALRAGAPRPARARADVAGLRLPRAGPGERALRRRDPRRSGVGPRRGVDAAQCRAPPRARGPVLHVPGPGRLPPAHRRRARRAPRGGHRHHRAGDRPEQRRGDARTSTSCAPRRTRRSSRTPPSPSPTAVTARSCGPSPPASRSSSSRTGATKPTTPGASPPATPASA